MCISLSQSRYRFSRDWVLTTPTAPPPQPSPSSTCESQSVPALHSRLYWRHSQKCQTSSLCFMAVELMTGGNKRYTVPLTCVGGNWPSRKRDCSMPGISITWISLHLDSQTSHMPLSSVNQFLELCLHTFTIISAPGNIFKACWIQRIGMRLCIHVLSTSIMAVMEIWWQSISVGTPSGAS